MTPQQAAAAEDALLRLATIDIPTEQRRLKQIRDPNSQQMLQEMAGTILSLMRDIAEGLVEVRDWSGSYMSALSDHMEALTERMDTVESYGADTTIIPEDGEVLAKAVLGCKYLAQSLLTGPFPIEERDDEGKQKLAELIAIAEQSEKIIADCTLVPDDDSDDDESDDESGQVAGQS